MGFALGPFVRWCYGLDRGPGMKFVPKALSSIAIAAFAAVSLTLATPHLSRAEGPIEVDSPAGDDPPNQVLEIPQACTLDGAPVPCEQSNAGDPANAADPDSNADGLASSTETANGANPPAANDNNYVDQAAAQDWGSLQEYESQAQMDNPVVSSAVPFVSGAMPHEAYLSPPLVAVMPVPIGPFVGAAPYVPPMLPAPGLAFGPRPAYIMMPRPISPFRPGMVRPMMPMGMPHAFRLR